MADQLCEETVLDQGMDTDTKPTIFSGCRHADGLHRMVELIDAGCDALNEVASCFGQPYATRMPLKKQNAKVFLQRLHAR